MAPKTLRIFFFFSPLCAHSQANKSSPEDCQSEIISISNKYELKANLLSTDQNPLDMKIDLGKVTSIQLTLAISVVPEHIDIVTDPPKSWQKFHFHKSLVQVQIQNTQIYNRGYPEWSCVSLVYNYITVMSLCRLKK